MENPSKDPSPCLPRQPIDLYVKCVMLYFTCGGATGELHTDYSCLWGIPTVGQRNLVSGVCMESKCDTANVASGSSYNQSSAWHLLQDSLGTVWWYQLNTVCTVVIWAVYSGTWYYLSTAWRYYLGTICKNLLIVALTNQSQCSFNRVVRLGQ